MAPGKDCDEYSTRVCCANDGLVVDPRRGPDEDRSSPVFGMGRAACGAFEAHPVFARNDIGQPSEQDAHRVWNAVNVSSWISFVLLQELSYNIDGPDRSLYISLGEGGVVSFVGVWDFDRSFLPNTPSSRWYFRELSQFAPLPHAYALLFSLPQFACQMAARWRHLRQGLLSDAGLATTVRDLVASVPVDAAARDRARWPQPRPSATPPLDSERDLLDWLLARAGWMDQAVIQLCPSSPPPAPSSFSPSPSSSPPAPSSSSSSTLRIAFQLVTTVCILLCVIGGGMASLAWWRRRRLTRLSPGSSYHPLSHIGTTSSSSSSE